MASGDGQVLGTNSFLLARAKVRSELEQSWWMYPVARFFGHALYEYRYDIDFSECTAAATQERNSMLYKSYCDLLGSLVAMCVIDRGHGTKSPDVIMGMIGHAFTHSEDKRELFQGILNLLRAVHGVQHFGCVIMRYCNFFKCLCLEDMKMCVTSTDLKLHTFWKQIMDSLSECIYEKENHKYYEELHKVFDFCEKFNLPSTLSSIPFICELGVKLNSGPNCDELMKDMQSQFTKAASYVKAIEFIEDPKEKSKARIDKEITQEDERSEDEGTTSDDVNVAKSVGDMKVQSKSEFMSPSESTQHDEIRTTEKITSPLSPYEAIQAVIEKYKSTNEPIPTSLLSNLSHLKTKDPYSEYIRSKSTKGHIPPSVSHSKSTKALSPPSALQSSVAVSQSDVVPASHAVSSPALLHKSKEKSLSPKLAFSSGLFSSDAAERNKIIVDLPNSDSSRESYILNEYDCRMKKHIAFQAASFELLNAQTGMHEVSNLIHQQRRFEERWPLRYSETTPSEEFYNESIFDIHVEVREFDMAEMVKESQQIIKVLQQLLHSVDTIKHR